MRRIWILSLQMRTVMMRCGSSPSTPSAARLRRESLGRQPVSTAQGSTCSTDTMSSGQAEGSMPRRTHPTLYADPVRVSCPLRCRGSFHQSRPPLLLAALLAVRLREEWLEVALRRGARRAQRRRASRGHLPRPRLRPRPALWRRGGPSACAASSLRFPMFLAAG